MRSVVSFEVPARSDKPVPDLDWMDPLAKLPPGPAVADALEVVAILRALGASKLDMFKMTKAVSKHLK